MFLLKILGSLHARWNFFLPKNHPKIDNQIAGNPSSNHVPFAMECLTDSCRCWFTNCSILWNIVCSKFGSSWWLFDCLTVPGIALGIPLCGVTDSSPKPVPNSELGTIPKRSSKPFIQNFFVKRWTNRSQFWVWPRTLLALLFHQTQGKWKLDFLLVIKSPETNAQERAGFSFISLTDVRKDILTVHLFVGSGLGVREDIACEHTKNQTFVLWWECVVHKGENEGPMPPRQFKFLLSSVALGIHFSTLVPVTDRQRILNAQCANAHNKTGEESNHGCFIPSQQKASKWTPCCNHC